MICIDVPMPLQYSPFYTNALECQELAMPCGKLVFINLFGSLMFHLLN